MKRAGERHASRGSLIGAYHRGGAPLEQRGLVFERRGRVSLADGSPCRLVTKGVVRAEELATSAPAELESCVACVEGMAVRTVLSFAADDGRRVVVSLTQRFDRLSVRRITELAGTLSLDGAVFGPACLRLDWRSSIGGG